MILCGITAIGVGLENATAQVSRQTTQQAASQTAATDGASFRPLFDGKSLDGWEGDPKWFRIEGDSIVAGSLHEKIPHNHFLCSNEEFGDFELTLEIRLVGEGKNAGVQFRSKRVAESTEVSGFQADAGWAKTQPIWGGIYDESRRREMLVMPDPEALEGKINQGQWNRMRILAVGPSIKVFINDHQTADYTETDSSIPNRGIIGLQIHSGPPTEAWYRNVMIRTIQFETDGDSNRRDNAR